MDTEGDQIHQMALYAVLAKHSALHAGAIRNTSVQLFFCVHTYHSCLFNIRICSTNGTRIYKLVFTK